MTPDLTAHSSHSPILPQLVAFAVLMQNGDGIINKSPGYVMEKWERCMGIVDVEWFGLDRENRALYEQWFEVWGNAL